MLRSNILNLTTSFLTPFHLTEIYIAGTFQTKQINKWSFYTIIINESTPFFHKIILDNSFASFNLQTSSATENQVDFSKLLDFLTN